jgi:UDP-N-acetylglucosamine 2-epimerase (non-hydrolysing)
MPEEINRLAVDAISNLYFVTESSALEHLLREGQPASAIYEVGNVMIDNLFYQNNILESGGSRGGGSPEMKSVNEFKRAREHARDGLGQAYGVLTLHRPSNVDDPETLSRLWQTVKVISADLPIAFAVHPRTRTAIESLGLTPGPNIHLFPPLPYMPFLELWKNAALVITDSGGLQEETTALGIPCITVRQNTERPITVLQGTNVLVGTHPETILQAFRSVIAAPIGAPIRRPPLWDGQAAQRIVSELARFLR